MTFFYHNHKPTKHYLLFLTAITETLAADVRSEFQTKRVVETEGQSFGELPFDGVLVRTRWTDARTIEIMEVTAMPEVPKELASVLSDEPENGTIPRNPDSLLNSDQETSNLSHLLDSE